MDFIAIANVNGGGGKRKEEKVFSRRDAKEEIPVP